MVIFYIFKVNFKYFDYKNKKKLNIKHLFEFVENSKLKTNYYFKIYFYCWDETMILLNIILCREVN